MAEKATSVYLPDDLREWVTAQADADDRSVSGFIVKVLRHHRDMSAAPVVVPKGAKS